MKNFTKILLLYILFLFVWGIFLNALDYYDTQILNQSTGIIEFVNEEPIEEELEVEIIEEEEYKFSIDNELQAITDIAQRITENYSNEYKGCTFSSSKYVIFRLSMELNFFFDNYKLIEQDFNEISKYGHSHLPSERNCIIMIEIGEKCMFLSENGKGIRY